jgi:predicted permease
LACILIGLGLNASGLKRPAIYSSIIAVFVPTSTILLLFSIGLSMELGKMRHYLKESLFIAGIKFLIVPVSMVSLGYVLNYHQINNGLPLKVILILSSTPVAFHALIPPSLYGLNLDLANSCWIFTTLCLIVWIPLLLFLVNII